MASEGKLEGYYLERLSPRLRMICNGDSEVNGNRAVLAGAVCDRHSEETSDLHLRLEPGRAKTRKRKRQSKEITKLDRLEDTASVSCFLRVHRRGQSLDELNEVSQEPSIERGEYRTALLTPADIRRLADQAFTEKGREPGDLTYIETGMALAAPQANARPGPAREPSSRLPKGLKMTGPKVLIGLIDVGGFDFSHTDFRNDTKKRRRTRFVRIWDQGAETGEPPKEFGYGREIMQKDMNKALNGAEEIGVDATDIVRQSVQRPGSHGTHVASIAAGRRGVCPHAAIAAVLISLPEDELQRRRTLFDSVRLAHAVDYLFDLGDQMGIPTVINISLGTNGHAHDGASPISRWMDAALDRPGQCVCVAAGNAGQESPQFDGDLGFLMGRIHASGRVPARGLKADLEWQVVGDGIQDISENELEIWYSSGDEFAVEVKPPGGAWTRPVRPGEFIENLHLELDPSGVGEGAENRQPGKHETFISIYNERYHPSNGDNRISIFLSPRLKEPVKGVTPGRWLVRLTGEEVRDGRFDAWIERDDPLPVGRIGDGLAWQFPSYFSLRSMVDRSSVNSLACGHRSSPWATPTMSSSASTPLRARVPRETVDSNRTSWRPGPTSRQPGGSLATETGGSPCPVRVWRVHTSRASPRKCWLLSRGSPPARFKE